MSKPNTFFRGSELPRLLVLLVILIFGLVYFWHVLTARDVPAVEPVVRADDPPRPVVPDQAPEFESVTDKTPVGLRDMAAYVTLLKRVEATPPDVQAGKGRRDVLYAHLWDNPAHFRGVPVHLLGTAFRSIRYESKKSRTGWLHEAWVVTTDSHPNPYVCIFEDPPKGFPLGAAISERVVFDGYFLKLMAYEARDTRRAAPLLIGRIGWTPGPTAQERGRGVRPQVPGWRWSSVSCSSSRSTAGSRDCAGLWHRRLDPRPRASVPPTRSPPRRWPDGSSRSPRCMNPTPMPKSPRAESAPLALWLRGRWAIGCPRMDPRPGHLWDGGIVAPMRDQERGGDGPILLLISLAPLASLTVTAATDRPSYSYWPARPHHLHRDEHQPYCRRSRRLRHESVTITRQGIEVWRMPGPMVCPTLALLLQPGQSRQ